MDAADCARSPAPHRPPHDSGDQLLQRRLLAGSGRRRGGGAERRDPLSVETDDDDANSNHCSGDEAFSAVSTVGRSEGSGGSQPATGRSHSGLFAVPVQSTSHLRHSSHDSDASSICMSQATAVAFGGAATLPVQHSGSGLGEMGVEDPRRLADAEEELLPSRGGTPSAAGARRRTVAAGAVAAGEAAAAKTSSSLSARISALIGNGKADGESTVDTGDDQGNDGVFARTRSQDTRRVPNKSNTTSGGVGVGAARAGREVPTGPVVVDTRLFFAPRVRPQPFRGPPVPSFGRRRARVRLLRDGTHVVVNSTAAPIQSTVTYRSSNRANARRRLSGGGAGGSDGDTEGSDGLAASGRSIDDEEDEENETDGGGGASIAWDREGAQHRRAEAAERADEGAVYMYAAGGQRVSLEEGVRSVNLYIPKVSGLQQPRSLLLRSSPAANAVSGAGASNVRKENSKAKVAADSSSGSLPTVSIAEALSAAAAGAAPSASTASSGGTSAPPASPQSGAAALLRSSRHRFELSDARSLWELLLNADTAVQQAKVMAQTRVGRAARLSRQREERRESHRRGSTEADSSYSHSSEDEGMGPTADAGKKNKAKPSATHFTEGIALSLATKTLNLRELVHSSSSTCGPSTMSQPTAGGSDLLGGTDAAAALVGGLPAAPVDLAFQPKLLALRRLHHLAAPTAEAMSTAGGGGGNGKAATSQQGVGGGSRGLGTNGVEFSTRFLTAPVPVRCPTSYQKRLLRYEILKLQMLSGAGAASGGGGAGGGGGGAASSVGGEYGAGGGVIVDDSGGTRLAVPLVPFFQLRHVAHLADRQRGLRESLEAALERSREAAERKAAFGNGNGAPRLPPLSSPPNGKGGAVTMTGGHTTSPSRQNDGLVLSPRQQQMAGFKCSAERVSVALPPIAPHAASPQQRLGGGGGGAAVPRYSPAVLEAQRGLTRQALLATVSPKALAASDAVVADISAKTAPPLIFSNVGGDRGSAAGKASATKNSSSFAAEGGGGGRASSDTAHDESVVPWSVAKLRSFAGVLSSPEVVAAARALFHDLTAKGPITPIIYAAFAKAFFMSVYVHLDTSEVCDLVLLDMPLDFIGGQRMADVVALTDVSRKPPPLLAVDAVMSARGVAGIGYAGVRGPAFGLPPPNAAAAVTPLKTNIPLSGAPSAILSARGSPKGKGAPDEGPIVSAASPRSPIVPPQSSLKNGAAAAEAPKPAGSGTTLSPARALLSAGDFAPRPAGGAEAMRGGIHVERTEALPPSQVASSEGQWPQASETPPPPASLDVPQSLGPSNVPPIGPLDSTESAGPQAATTSGPALQPPQQPSALMAATMAGAGYGYGAGRESSVHSVDFASFLEMINGNGGTRPSTEASDGTAGSFSGGGGGGRAATAEGGQQLPSGFPASLFSGGPQSQSAAEARLNAVLRSVGGGGGSVNGMGGGASTANARLLVMLGSIEHARQANRSGGAPQQRAMLQQRNGTFWPLQQENPTLSEGATDDDGAQRTNGKARRRRLSIGGAAAAAGLSPASAVGGLRLRPGTVEGRGEMSDTNGGGNINLTELVRLSSEAFLFGGRPGGGGRNSGAGPGDEGSGSARQPPTLNAAQPLGALHRHRSNNSIMANGTAGSLPGSLPPFNINGSGKSLLSLASQDRSAPPPLGAEGGLLAPPPGGRGRRWRQGNKDAKDGSSDLFASDDGSGAELGGPRVTVGGGAGGGKAKASRSASGSRPQTTGSDVTSHCSDASSMPALRLGSPSRDGDNNKVRGIRGVVGKGATKGGDFAATFATDDGLASVDGTAFTGTVVLSSAAPDGYAFSDISVDKRAAGNAARKGASNARRQSVVDTLRPLDGIPSSPLGTGQQQNQKNNHLSVAATTGRRSSLLVGLGGPSSPLGANNNATSIGPPQPSRTPFTQQQVTSGTAAANGNAANDGSATKRQQPPPLPSLPPIATSATEAKGFDAAMRLLRDADSHRMGFSDFLHWLQTLALAWCERGTAAEALLFLQALRRFWEPLVDVLDVAYFPTMLTRKRDYLFAVLEAASEEEQLPPGAARRGCVPRGYSHDWFSRQMPILSDFAISSDARLLEAAGQCVTASAAVRAEAAARRVSGSKNGTYGRNESERGGVGDDDAQQPTVAPRAPMQLHPAHRRLCGQIGGWDVPERPYSNNPLIAAMDTNYSMVPKNLRRLQRRLAATAARQRAAEAAAGLGASGVLGLSSMADAVASFNKDVANLPHQGLGAENNGAPSLNSRRQSLSLGRTGAGLMAPGSPAAAAMAEAVAAAAAAAGNGRRQSLQQQQQITSQNASPNASPRTGRDTGRNANAAQSSHSPRRSPRTAALSAVNPSPRSARGAASSFGHSYGTTPPLSPTRGAGVSATTAATFGSSLTGGRSRIGGAFAERGKRGAEGGDSNTTVHRKAAEKPRPVDALRKGDEDGDEEASFDDFEGADPPFTSASASCAGPLLRSRSRPEEGDARRGDDDDAAELDFGRGSVGANGRSRVGDGPISNSNDNKAAASLSPQKNKGVPLVGFDVGVASAGGYRRALVLEYAAMRGRAEAEAGDHHTQLPLRGEVPPTHVDTLMAPSNTVDTRRGGALTNHNNSMAAMGMSTADPQEVRHFIPFPTTGASSVAGAGGRCPFRPVQRHNSPFYNPYSPML